MLHHDGPGGSARSEIRRRVLARSEDGQARAAMISFIIDELVDEMVEASRLAQKEEAAGRMKALN